MIYKASQKPPKRRYKKTDNVHPITGHVETATMRPSKTITTFSINSNFDNGFRSMIV